jgi:hypothetical protein
MTNDASPPSASERANATAPRAPAPHDPARADFSHGAPARADSSRGDPAQRPNARIAALLVLSGLVIGAWSAMCGVGGGVFAVPLLHYGFKLRLKAAVGSSLLLVAASTTSATFSELFHRESSLHWGVVITLILASSVGARCGFWVAQRISANALKLCFALALTAVATHLAFEHGARIATTAAGIHALAFTPLEYAALAGIGLGAGFVAPLLGVGGGLIAVPSLLFGFPVLGFLGARAASMAMSVFTAWQSAFFYRRENELAVALAAWLALGALAGGFVGVALVHIDGASQLAQRMLSLTLYLVAARFAWDVFVARREGRGTPARS